MGRVADTGAASEPGVRPAAGDVKPQTGGEHKRHRAFSSFDCRAAGLAMGKTHLPLSFAPIWRGQMAVRVAAIARPRP
jgi:hypothetical protein